MHPYSEYLQQYIYDSFQLEEGGKFKNDFRRTAWGTVFRKLWIDELPQLINFFQGEVALFGVRALSEHYFSLYPPDMQDLRTKVKPGLVPPFYADMPTTFEEIIESERRYVEKRLKKGFIVDVEYFCKAWYNIIFKHARSN
jgi:lipopolysaccharide/colanic/teichoic acid biosynthesis glycosyltransferase